AASAVYSRRGRSPSGRTFFRGTPFEPPRAGISPRTRMRPDAGARDRVMVVLLIVRAASVREPFLDRQTRGSERLGDSLSGAPVSIHRIGEIPSIGHLMAQARENLLAAVTDIENVPSPLAPFLARADVHDRHAEEGGFADPHARVAQETPAVEDETQKVGGRKILEEVNVGRPLHLPKCPDRIGGSIGAGIDIRPEPERRHPELGDGME